jgi:hypothetical protein
MQGCRSDLMRRLADCHCLVLCRVGLIPLAVTNRIESEGVGTIIRTGIDLLITIRHDTMQHNIIPVAYGREASLAY